MADDERQLERDDDGFLTVEGMREYLVYHQYGERAYLQDPLIHGFVEAHVVLYRELREAEALLEENGVTPPRKRRSNSIEVEKARDMLGLDACEMTIPEGLK